LDDELPGQVVLADAGYGNSVEFRNGVVIVANRDGGPVADRDPLWLVVEWPDDEKAPRSSR